jgi:hypothetical protein
VNPESYKTLGAETYRQDRSHSLLAPPRLSPGMVGRRFPRRPCLSDGDAASHVTMRLAAI